MNGRTVLSYTIVATIILAFIVPTIAITPVHAAGAAISLSPTEGSGRVRSARMFAVNDRHSTSAGVNIASGTIITITGTGLPTDQDSITFRILSTSSTPAAGQGTQLTTTAGSGDLSDATDFGTASSSVKADAEGYFKVKIRVPDGFKAGTYYIFAEYTPSGGTSTISATATLTIVAKISVVNTYDQTANGIHLTPVEILAANFDTGETISITPTNFLTTTIYGATALSSFALAAYGTYTAPSGNANLGYIGTRPGGTITITASGQTSGLTATASFTIKPSIAVLHSVSNIAFQPSPPTTQLSISASSSVIWLAGKNFAASKIIDASTATLTSGSTTQTLTHSSLTTNPAGDFGATKFTYTSGVTLGEIKVGLPSSDATLSSAQEFSLANKNVIPPGVGGTVSNDVLGALIERGDLGGGIATAGDRRLGIAPGVAILASQVAGPPVVTKDKSSYKVGDVLYLFGVGMAQSVSFTPTYNPTGGTAAAPTLGVTNRNTDGLGAIFQFIAGTATTVGSASLAGLPQSRKTISTESSNTLTFAVGSGTAPDSTTVTVAPKIHTFGGSSTFPTSDYSRDREVSATGFYAESLSVTLGGVTWTSIASTSVGATGTVSVTLTDQPDIPGGASGQTLTIGGTTSGNTATGVGTGLSVTVYVTAAPDSSTTSALSQTSGSAGDQTSLLTASTYGLHGLLASTEYDVYFGAASTYRRTITTTSSGTLPAGVTLIVPSIPTGNYTIDLRVKSTGVSGIWDKLLSSSIDQFTNLRYKIIGKITLTPAVTTSDKEVSGSIEGGKASEAYVVTLGTANTTPEAISRQSVTTGTDGKGTFKFTMPRKATSGSNGELGTLYYVFIQTSTQFGTTGETSFDARGTLVLQTSVVLPKTSFKAGESFTFNIVSAENAGVYRLIFNYKQSATTTTSYTGDVAGTAAADSEGTALSVPAVIPSNAEAGKSYPVNLVVVSGSSTTAGTAVIADLTVTVVADVLPPTITDVSTSPAAPKVGDTITVSATVTAASGTTISSVTLYYMSVGATSFISTAMTLSAGKYMGTIPAQTAAGTLQWYIEAKDAAANTAYNPSTAPTTPGSLTIAEKPPVTGTDTATLTSAGTTTTAGVSQSSFALGSTVAFSVSFKNNAATAMNFLAIVQVKSAEGAVVAISYTNLNNVAAGQTLSASLSPIITGSGLLAAKGTYTFQIFVFDNLTTATALSLPTTAVSFTLT